MPVASFFNINIHSHLLRTTVPLIPTDTKKDTHQGWITNPTGQGCLFLDDELDGANYTGPAGPGNAVTYIGTFAAWNPPSRQASTIARRTESTTTSLL